MTYRSPWNKPEKFFDINLSRNVHFDQYLNNKVFEILRKKTNHTLHYADPYEIYKSISDYYKIHLKNLTIGFGATDILYRITKILDVKDYYVLSPTFEVFEVYCKLNFKKFKRVKKSEIYLNKAQLYAVIGNKVKSRNNARRSISMNSGNTDAYKLIGNLYMSSYDDCREGKSRVQDRLVFIAAYNIFKSGGLTSQANQAREQFPSMEEIFNENMEVGESMNTGCWINETVTLNKR